MAQPASFAALHARAIAAAQAGRFEQALQLLDAALALVPRHPPALVDRGNVQRLLGRRGAALADLDRAVEAKRDYPDAHFHRAFLLGEMGRVEAALAGYDAVLLLRPEHAAAHNNRGNALKHLERLDEALAAYERAIALEPRYAEAHFNHGVALQAMGRLPEALEAFDRAIAARPGYADACWNKSLLLLLMGRYEEGWALYEWRWKRKPQRAFEAPLWLGREPLAGRTILLHAEQGFGDTLQFCRYAPEVAKLGAHVVLEAPPELAVLLQALRGVRAVVARGEPLPRFDCHCPLLSLPHAFRTDLASVPAEVPYLRADPARVAHWRERLGEARKPRIGIAWSGRAAQTDDARRSMTLADLAPLLTSRYEIVSLQKEVRERDRATLERHAGIRHFGDELRDFGDTAALCELVDAVLSVDSSVAHLAGALGRELHLLLAWMPDWRWLLGRDDNPWYPSATLYRQSRAGDWASAVARVQATLEATFVARA